MISVVEYALRRSDIVEGNIIHQLLADYQDEANGGNGWLRILRFSPLDDKIYVSTYSPYLDSYKTDAENQFVLDFDMNEDPAISPIPAEIIFVIIFCIIILAVLVFFLRKK